ncbi:hypothetical protein GSI_10291 [Ganoderma sinense ZZ0214-1]|uniref:Uncharacterized protein n=1 Tax=Ganoderma sinense ZZ0214-1 TaxID=1077348 RepID=A0A2G8S054_9APHY|nr:hypothetical protein GSI_10291 [Ganoderma sinense ZZ0214-1]
MGNSLEDWKREPTTAGALFNIDLPYRPPKNPVGAFLWRQRFWIETTSGLSVLEPWEKILTLALLYFLLTLVFTGVYKVVPQQAPLLYRRTLYYLFGSEGSDSALSVANWASRNTSIGDL